jgi:hypothetical protein
VPIGDGQQGPSSYTVVCRGGCSQLARRHRRAPDACCKQLQRAQNRSGAAEHRVVHGGTWTVQQRRRRNGCRSERGRGCSGRCVDEWQGAQRDSRAGRKARVRLAECEQTRTGVQQAARAGCGCVVDARANIGAGGATVLASQSPSQGSRWLRDPREWLDIDYRRLSSINSNSSNNDGRLCLCFVASMRGGVGGGFNSNWASCGETLRCGGRGQRSKERRCWAPGVLAAASASAVEVGRTVKPHDFGRARASPLKAPRSEAAVACCELPVCARLAAQGASSGPAPVRPQAPKSRAPRPPAVLPHQPAAMPCSTLRDVSLLCVCPSSPPCHLVCPGELVMPTVLLPAARHRTQTQAAGV